MLAGLVPSGSSRGASVPSLPASNGRCILWLVATSLHLHRHLHITSFVCVWHLLFLYLSL